MFTDLDVFGIFALASVVIGLSSGIFLSYRAWVNRHRMVGLILTLMAIAVIWVVVVYFFSFYDASPFKQPTDITTGLGVWIRPVMPILLAGPALLVLVGKI